MDDQYSGWVYVRWLTLESTNSHTNCDTISNPTHKERQTNRQTERERERKRYKQTQTHTQKEREMLQHIGERVMSSGIT